MIVTETPAGDRARLSLWLLAARLTLSAAPVIFGVCCGILDTRTIDPAEIAASEGHRYTAPVHPASHGGMFQVEGDHLRHPRRAATRLYEDGRLLGPPHRPHDYIRDDGRGQFSHWGRSTLYFSASDNSDPRTNGRTYSVVTASRLPIGWLWLWAAVVVAATVLSSLWRLAPGALTRRERRRFTMVVWPAVVVLYAGLWLVSLNPAFRGRAVLEALWGASLLACAILSWQSGQLLARIAPVALVRWRPWTEALAARAERPFARSGWAGYVARFATLVIPLAVFVVLLRTPLPPEMLSASYFSLTPVALPAGVLLSWCHLRRGWISTVAGLTMTMGLFALPLAALWQHIGIHYNAIGGLLPFSDAGGYYFDARRLLEGHPLGWSARRPLFVGLLSTLLALTSQNLQVSLAVLVALNAAACFLLARELRENHGPVAAAVATIVLFLFYRVDGGAGTTLTENLGFAMGTLSFAALWRGTRERDARGFSVGMGLLTIALLARAGAFFVLPAVVLAGVWAARGRRVSFGLAGTAAVVVAAALTIAVGRHLADPAGAQTAFSNFSYSLYGLVVGGKGWEQVVRDHPEAREGEEIYRLAYRAFLANPLGVAEGSAKMWKTYLSPAERYHAFAFVVDGTHSRLFQMICYVLSAVGLTVSIRRYREPSSALLLAGTIGHLSSIPFVPPIDAGLRVYAATLPILAILVSVGAAALLRGARHLTHGSGPEPQAASADKPGAHTWPTCEALGVALAAVVLVGPLAVFATSRPPRVQQAPCPGLTVAAYVRFSPGSALRILGDVPDVDDTRIAVPEIRERDLRRTAGAVELKNDRDRFTAGQTMLNAHDVVSGRPLWLVVPTGLVPRSSGLFRVCGVHSPDPVSRSYGVFYAESVSDGASRRGNGGETSP